jgi:hypothetical protein
MVLQGGALERIQKPKPGIVAAEIWQTGENLKPILGTCGSIFLTRLALSEISRETLSTWIAHKHATNIAASSHRTALTFIELKHTADR